MSTATGPSRFTRLGALLRQRCPRCREGRVFRGLLAMHPRCPRCDVAFEPEQGYFVGSMYLAYAFAVAIVGGLTLAGVHLWPEVRAHVVFAFAALAYLPLVPLVFRFSRLVWMTLDPVFRRE